MSASAAVHSSTQRALLRRRIRRRHDQTGDEAALLEPSPLAQIGAGLAAPTASLARSLGPTAILALQRTHGNRYVQRLLAEPAVQRCGGDSSCGCAHCGEQEDPETPSPATPVPVAPQRVQRQPGGQPLLRLGSKSPAVADLQQKLGISADGIFGPATHKAVVAFQQSAGLTPDGVVGPKTWAKLNGGGESAGPAGPAGAPNPLEAKRALLLAKFHEVSGAFKTIAAKPETVAPAAATDAPGLSIDDPSVIAPIPLSYGWLDDAVAWAEDKAEAAGQWVEEKAEAASDWVDEKADAAGDWVEDKVDAAGDWVEEKIDQGKSWVEETVGSVSETVSEVAEQVSEAASGVVSEVQSLAEGMKERYGKELQILEDVVKSIGRASGLTPGLIDDAIARLNAILAGLAKDVAAQHGGALSLELETAAAANGSTNITSSATTHELSAPNIRAAFASPAHRGATKPKFLPNEKPELTLGSDNKVSSAKLNVAITKSLPKWKELDQQCDKAKQAWASYLSALDVHEDKHVTIYKSYFTANDHTQFVGKTESEAATRFRAMKTEAKAKNDDLDTTTNHGRTDTPSTVVADPGC